MKVILDLDDGLMKLLRKEARRRSTTIMALVEDAFRLELAKLSGPKEGGKDEPLLPGWNSLDFLVRIVNNDEVYRTTWERLIGPT